MNIPIVKNTVTNYLGMAVKLLQGILITRWLLADLGEEYYGLWALLWSFFCYSLLLDFGFGVTAQKYTSVGYYRTNPEKYNKIISTIFSFHAAMAFLIAAGTYAASFFVVPLFNLHGAPAEKIQFCKTCFLLFGLGSALIFPTGIFPEILVGLQQIYLRNYIQIISKIAELAGILLLFGLGGNLIALIVFNLVLSAATNLAMWWFIRRSIPQMRMRLRIDRESFHEIFHFSGFVYLCSMARLLWERGSSLLISMFCGLGDVGFFRIGGRLPSLMSQLTGPYQENISPISAAYYARKKHKVLATILLNSMRWNSFLSTGMMVGIFLYAPELLQILFKFCNPVSVEVCRWMVVSLYVSLVFRTIPERFLMMAERHKLLSWITLSESAAYMVLCVVLLQKFSIVSVVWSALLLKVFTLIFVIGPNVMKYLKFSLWNVLSSVCLKPLLAALPLVGAALLMKSAAIPEILRVLIGGSIGAVFYLLIFYLLVLSSGERKFFLQKIAKKVPALRKFLGTDSTSRGI